MSTLMVSLNYFLKPQEDQKINHMAEAALEMNLTCNDLKKDLDLTDGDVIDMLQLVMDGFKNRN